jgi:transcriptional regulator with XRE-family HTH domain
MASKRKASGICFGQWLAKTRDAQGKTQEQLAESADLSRNFISLLENGQRKPSLETARKIGLALGADWNEVVSASAEAPAVSVSAARKRMARLLEQVPQDRLETLEEILRLVISLTHANRR